MLIIAMHSNAHIHDKEAAAGMHIWRIKDKGMVSLASCWLEHEGCADATTWASASQPILH